MQFCTICRWRAEKADAIIPAGPEQPDEATPKPADRTRQSSASGDGTASMYGLVGIGFEFLTAICLFGAIGWYADSRLKTLPWLTIAGAAVGFAAGLTLMVRAGKSAFKD